MALRDSTRTSPLSLPPLNAGLPPLPGFFNAEEVVLEVSWVQENHIPNRQSPLFLTVDQQGGRTVGEREEFLPSSANPNGQQNTLRAAVGHSLRVQHQVGGVDER